MSIDASIANLGLFNLLALLLVSVIGLPHGAFDSAIATHLGYIGRPLTLMRFLLLYTFLTASIVALWLLFPIVSLIVFLLISTIHFGLGDARAERGWFKWVQVITHGLTVVVGISQLHKSEVDKIFGYIIGHDAAMVWVAIDMMSIILVVSFVIYAWQSFWDTRWRYGFFELILLLLLFAILPPLVSFALYFCCVHSLRHFLTLWRSLSSMYQFNDVYFHAISYTIASWIIGGIAFWWCAELMSGEIALLRVVFIGLAALTVPHMILVDGFFRRYSDSSP